MYHDLHQHKFIGNNILVAADNIDVLRPRSCVLYVWSSLQIRRCRSIQKETSNILLRDARDKVTMFETSLALIKHLLAQ
jgi:hypothetical protein